MRRLILGGPGSGKTERLITIVQEEIRGGTPPHLIAFVSFTRKAVIEAKERIRKSIDIRPKDLPFFRTLHSLCYWQTGVRSDQVLTSAHLKEIGRELNVRISGKISLDDDSGMFEGDRMLFLDGLARSSMKSLEEVWDEHPFDLPWFQVKRFSDMLRKYKRQKNLVDFGDMLEMFIERGTVVGVDAAVIDEAQDLTAIQWMIVDRAFADCRRIYIAGDDDQAIYEWSGADVRRFRSLDVGEKEVLPVSYRLPKKIFDFSKKIAETIVDRYEKYFRPTRDGGSVQRCSSIDQIDLSGKGSWLLLSRNVCFLNILEDACIEQGVPYSKRGGYSSINQDDITAIKAYERMRKGSTIDPVEANLVFDRLGMGRRIEHDARLSDVGDRGIWHDAFIGLTPKRRAYYLAILRAKRNFSSDPPIHIDTIHGVKGGEADNVVLLTDLTRATEEGYEKRPDAETRVFYVGATRAKNNLFVVAGTTNRSFFVDQNLF